MSQAPRDDNRITSLLGKSDVTGLTVPIGAKTFTGPYYALDVAIVDGSGNQITSFGGGTQYADGDTQATPTGTVAMGKNPSNLIKALSLDASGYLQVNVAAGGASGGTSSTFGAAVPGTGTASGYSDGTNMQAARVFDVDSGAGTQYVVGVSLRKIASGGSVEAGTSTDPLRVDPTGTTTQPVSASSLPLPTGASTAAKQPALGTAGTPSSDVITVQGITSMTALKVDGSGVTQPVSLASVPSHPVTNAGTFATQVDGAALTALQLIDDTVVAQSTALGSTKNSLIAGSVTTAAPTYTTGNINPLSLTTAGALRVDNSGVTQPVSGTVSITANSAVNMAQINGIAPSMGSGNNGTGVQRVTLANDQSACTTVGLFSVKLDQTTPGTTNAVSLAQIGSTTVASGNGTVSAGVQRVSIASDNTVLPAVGAGATGSAVPANASYTGFIASTALPTAGTAGNMIGAMSDKFGRQVMLPGTIRDLVGTQTTTISSSTSETTIVTAAASVFNDLTALVVSNTSATAARVDFRDTTGGSVLFSLYVPAGDTRGISLGGFPIPQTTVNTNWTAQSSASVADLRVYAVFMKNK